MRRRSFLSSLLAIAAAAPFLPLKAANLRKPARDLRIFRYPDLPAESEPWDIIEVPAGWTVTGLP